MDAQGDLFGGGKTRTDRSFEQRLKPIPTPLWKTLWKNCTCGV